MGVLASLVLLAPALAHAAEERPNAMRLFPGRSVFFIRSPEAAAFLEKITESDFFQDPEIKPFLDTLFGKVDTAFAEGEPGEVTGGGLGDLLRLFQGEVAFSITPRRNESPGFLFLADTVSDTQRATGDPLAVAAGQERVAQLIAAVRSKAEKEGDQVAEEVVGSSEVVVIRQGDNARESGGILQRDGVLLISNDRILLESVINKWDEATGVVPPSVEASENEGGTDDEATNDEATNDEDEAKRVRRLRARYADTLADNEAYTESLRECVEERIGGGDSAPPNVSVFIDPVGIFRSIAQRNNGMRVALATLPILGLDGVEGAAAALWVDYGDWDTLFRAHLLLDNPRAGVLKMARLKPCDPTPGDTIPADVAAYTCGAIDFAATLDGAGQLYDRIRGEGEFAKLVEGNVTKTLGVAPEELLERITGRVATCQGYGDPDAEGVVRISPIRALVIDTTDPVWIDATLRSVLERINAPATWSEHGGYECVRFIDLARPDGEESRQQRRQRRRLEASGVMTCAAVVEDQLVLAQSLDLLHKLIDTKAGLHERLADHLPFRMTANRAKRLGRGVASDAAGGDGRLLTYSDPGSQFRQWHAAGTSDESREQLDRLAERAPPMRWLRETLEETGVPSAEALMQYATPTGGALFDTPRGFRYVAFAFKLEED